MFLHPLRLRTRSELLSSASLGREWRDAPDIHWLSDRNSLPPRRAYKRHKKPNYRNLTQANRGRLNGPQVTPSSCPASPAESFEKPLAASAMQAAEPRRVLRWLDRRKHSSEHKISTTIGHYVRGFQGCQAVSKVLTLFSYDFIN